MSRRSATLLKTGLADVGKALADQSCGRSFCPFSFSLIVLALIEGRSSMSVMKRGGIEYSERRG